MRNKTKAKATVGMLLGLLVAAAIPSPAMAATTDGTSAPTVTQQEGQALLNSITTKKSASVPAPLRQAAAGGMTTNAVSTNATYSRRASLRAGNFPLWHEINVDFYYNYSRVTSSYGWQSGLQAGLNTIKMTGVRKTYDDGWTHNHHASAQLGVGVPTPWGGVNIFEATSNLFTRVHGDGAWGAWN